MPDTVKFGVYFGFTLEELLAELTRYKEAVQSSGSDVSTESIADQSFSYGPRRDMSLAQWQVQLQAALHQLSPDDYPLERASARARMRS